MRLLHFSITKYLGYDKCYAFVSKIKIIDLSLHITLIILLSIFVIEKCSNPNLYIFKLLTFTKKIEKPLSTRMNMCSKANLYYYLKGFTCLRSSFFLFKNILIFLCLSRDKIKRQSGKNTTLIYTKKWPRK